MANIKPVNLKVGAITKEEKRKRMEAEGRLKGSADKVTPPDYLSESQRAIFEFVVQELDAAQVLGNLDIYVLSNFSIAADRIKQIEQMINSNPDNLLNKALMSSRSKYAKDFMDNLRELGGLSPASRAKLGTINLAKQQEEQDPLLQALGIAPKRG